MEAYHRFSNSGHKIDWKPENDQSCCKALVECDGTGINSVEEAKEKCPIKLDNETARKVRKEYQKFVDGAV